MYNAYAGFITSILSVQATGIKSINDILSYDFKLGYSITDDEYIRVRFYLLEIKEKYTTEIFVCNNKREDRKKRKNIFLAVERERQSSP